MSSPAQRTPCSSLSIDERRRCKCARPVRRIGLILYSLFLLLFFCSCIYLVWRGIWGIHVSVISEDDWLQCKTNKQGKKKKKHTQLLCGVSSFTDTTWLLPIACDGHHLIHVCSTCECLLSLVPLSRAIGDGAS